MTTQTMIEKMCRAVWQHERDTNQHAEPFRLSWYEPSMRAALQALREPTEGMVNAGAAMHVFGGAYVGEQGARDSFTAMIDAALQEKTMSTETL